jgi:pseudaminic acid synthase
MFESFIKGKRTFIVAELSANHGHRLETALKLVQAAKECGADAVKLQTYTADTITLDCSNEYFQIKHGTIWDGTTLHKLYGEAYTPWEWHRPIQEAVEREGMIFFSTPFDFSAVDFLESLNVPLYKIASFELVDLPLIRKVALTGKPAIISTGMATLGEIDEAVRTFRDAGGKQLVLLKCTSAYPTPPEEMNLRTIPHLAEAFDTPVGLSDHTLGIAVPVAAVALGACVIEKHLTMDRSEPGPDSAFSLEPAEFKSMVEAVRTAEQALGYVTYEASEKEKASRSFRRSLFIVQDIKAGDIFTEENVRSIRPGYGLPVKHAVDVLGRRAARDIKRGTPLTWDMLNGGPSLER